MAEKGIDTTAGSAQAPITEMEAWTRAHVDPVVGYDYFDRVRTNRGLDDERTSEAIYTALEGLAIAAGWVRPAGDEAQPPASTGGTA